jgi:carbamoyl-phosphate synthase large subunit
MNIKERLKIPDDLWEKFKAWKSTVGIDRSTDDWVELRMQIHNFIFHCYKSYEFEDPVIELGSWSLIPGGDFSYFKDKYTFYRTNISYGNRNAPVDFLLDAMDMTQIANESVGCLIATDILEHLPDPFRALQEFYRVLKNGGYVLITVPFYFEIHGDDYVRFTELGLKRGLGEAGFDEVTVTCKGGRPLNIQAVVRKSKRFSLLFLGGGTRCSHIEHFKKRFRVVTTDTKKDAPSIAVADKVYLTREFSSPDFADQLMDIVLKEHISAVLPSSHYSIEALMAVRDELDKLDVPAMLPENDVTKACLDKAKTPQLFKKAGLSVVPTCDERNPSFPLYFKASRGSGEKGSFLVQNEHHLRGHLENYKSYILQEYVEGDEYTVDVLCDFNGKLLLAVPRLRIEKGFGEIVKGRVLHEKRLISLIKQLTASVRFVGLLTVQCFERDGHFFFNEINPRFGGGLTFSIASGAPFVEFLERMMAGETLDYFEDWAPNHLYSRAYRDFEIRITDDIKSLP